jgi:hypothetical protein
VCYECNYDYSLDPFSFLRTQIHTNDNTNCHRLLKTSPNITERVILYLWGMLKCINNSKCIEAKVFMILCIFITVAELSCAINNVFVMCICQSKEIIFRIFFKNG